MNRVKGTNKDQLRNRRISNGGLRSKHRSTGMQKETEHLEEGTLDGSYHLERQLLPERGLEAGRE